MVENNWVTYGFSGKIRVRNDQFSELYSNDGRKENETYLRRADFEVSGSFFQRLDYELEVKVNNDGEYKTKSISLGAELPYGFQFSAGRMDPDFGLELTGSSTWTTGVERSAIWDLSPDAGEGEDGEGLILRQRSKHHFISIGGTDRGDFNYLNARLVIAPLQKKDHVLHLGFSYAEAQNFSSNGRIRSDLAVWGLGISDNGNSTQLARAEDEPVFDGDQSQLIEFAYMNGPFSIQAEQLTRDLSGIEQGGRTAQGRYVQVAYTFTGEPRDYSIKNAKFGRIKPKGVWGSWEMFYRKDWLETLGEADMLSNNRTQGNAEVDAIGINWSPNDHWRLSVNYLKAIAPDIPNDAENQKGEAFTSQLLFNF